MLACPVSQISRRPDDEGWIVLVKTKSGIASMAEQTSQFACVVAVIDTKFVECPPADRANPLLLLQPQAEFFQ
jgi:hypothetical protein